MLIASPSKTETATKDIPGMHWEGATTSPFFQYLNDVVLFMMCDGTFRTLICDMANLQTRVLLHAFEVC